METARRSLRSERSGTQCNRKAFAALAGLALLAATAADGSPVDAPPRPTRAAAPASTSPLTLEKLMGMFAESGGVRARFRERKYLALLTDPLESGGVVYFVPPDRLARHVTDPGRSSVVVQGDHLVLRDEAGEERLELGESEIARHFVENFIVVLRGDLAALRSRYSVSFQADGDLWRIELVPRSALVRRFLASIELEGRGIRLRRAEVRQQEGDRTVTEFHEVEVGLRFTPDQLERIFSVGPAAPPS